MLSIQALWKEQKYVILRHELLERSNQYVSQLRMVKNFWMFCWKCLIKKFPETFSCFSETFLEKTSELYGRWKAGGGRKRKKLLFAVEYSIISLGDILDPIQAFLLSIWIEYMNLPHPFYSSYFGMSIKNDHKSSIWSGLLVDSALSGNIAL